MFKVYGVLATTHPQNNDPLTNMTRTVRMGRVGRILKTFWIGFELDWPLRLPQDLKEEQNKP